MKDYKIKQNILLGLLCVVLSFTIFTASFHMTDSAYNLKYFNEVLDFEIVDKTATGYAYTADQMHSVAMALLLFSPLLLVFSGLYLGLSLSDFSHRKTHNKKCRHND